MGGLATHQGYNRTFFPLEDRSIISYPVVVIDGFGKIQPRKLKKMFIQSINC